MVYIDFILNVAALLLWLNWRSVRLDPFSHSTPATLAGTVRRIEPSGFKRLHFLSAIGGLLFLRAVFYWLIGPAVSWTPKLELVVVTLPFPSHVFLATLLYSVLSFLRVLMIFYFWLLVLAAINRRKAEADPIQKMLTLQLGRPARWSAWAQVLFAPLVVAALWMTLHPVLLYVNVVNRVQSFLHLVEQGLLVGGCLVFSLKYLLPVFLLTHLIASYVYLGKSPLWDFVSLTAGNLLAPFRKLPLRLGKFDLLPVLGIALIWLLLHTLPRLALRDQTIWPL